MVTEDDVVEATARALREAGGRSPSNSRRRQLAST